MRSRLRGATETAQPRSGAGRAAPPGAFAARLPMPFAVLGLETHARALIGVRYLPLGTPALPPQDVIAAQAARELAGYLTDPQFRFGVPLAPRGTPFQRRVWDAIGRIPVGESRTYGEIARSLRSAPRAVGQACGANPIALLVPCHRVVGSRGALGGFMHTAGGGPLAIKRWLLVHEGYRFGA